MYVVYSKGKTKYIIIVETTRIVSICIYFITYVFTYNYYDIIMQLFNNNMHTMYNCILVLIEVVIVCKRETANCDYLEITFYYDVSKKLFIFVVNTIVIMFTCFII